MDQGGFVKNVYQPRFSLKMHNSDQPRVDVVRFFSIQKPFRKVTALYRVQFQAFAA